MFSEAIHSRARTRRLPKGHLRREGRALGTENHRGARLLHRVSPSGTGIKLIERRCRVPGRKGPRQGNASRQRAILITGRRMRAEGGGTPGRWKTLPAHIPGEESRERQNQEGGRRLQGEKTTIQNAQEAGRGEVRRGVRPGRLDYRRRQPWQGGHVGDEEARVGDREQLRKGMEGLFWRSEPLTREWRGRRLPGTPATIRVFNGSSGYAGEPGHYGEGPGEGRKRLKSAEGWAAATMEQEETGRNRHLRALVGRGSQRAPGRRRFFARRTGTSCFLGGIAGFRSVTAGSKPWRVGLIGQSEVEQGGDRYIIRLRVP